jgi:hypothetical protein
MRNEKKTEQMNGKIEVKCSERKLNQGNSEKTQRKSKEPKSKKISWSFSVSEGAPTKRPVIKCPEL